MEKGRSLPTDRILELTLEIIYLLTGEEYKAVKKISGEPIDLKNCPQGRAAIMVPSTHSPTPEMSCDQKILEVTRKIIELLTGEVPIRCQDVTVYFSMEEWEYVERHEDLYKDVMMEEWEYVQRHEDLYKDVMMEDRLPLTSPGGDDGCNTTEGPTLSAGSNEEDDGTPQYPPGLNLVTQYIHHKLDHMVRTKELLNSEESNDKSHAIIQDVPPSCHSTNGSPNPSNTESNTESSSNNLDAVTKKDNKIFSCSECGKCFTSISSLSGHQRTHTGKGPFFCLECGKGFTRKRALVFHQSSHTNEGPFPCLYCNKPFMKKHDLLQHQKLHVRKPLYPCSHCKKSFRNKPELVQHQRIHTGEKSFPCPESTTEKEKTSVRSDQLPLQEGEIITTIIKEEHFLESGTGGDDGWTPSEEHLIPLPDYKEGDNVVKYPPGISLGPQYVHHRLDVEITTDRLNSEESNEKAAVVTPIIQPSCRSANGSLDNPKEPSSNQSDSVTTKDSNTFSCSECGKCFTSIWSLSGHQRTHTGKGPFFCLECGKGFTRKRALVFHQSSHTNEGPFPCMYCSKPFMKKHDLLQHQKLHVRKPPFSCSKCKKCFGSEQELSEHKRIHGVGKKAFPCPELKKDQREAYARADRPSVREGEKTASTIKQEAFVDGSAGGHDGWTSPEGHPVIPPNYNGAAQYPSGVSFTTQYPHHRADNMPRPTELLRPEPSNNKSNAVIPNAQASFSRPPRHSNLEESSPSNSTETVTKKVSRTFACSECGKCFASVSSLSGHQRTHTGKGPFFCLECGKGFTRKRALVFHQSSHTNDGPFACRLCSKPFMTKHDLALHHRTHAPPPAFPCSVCKQSFRNNRELARHQSIHVREKPLPCFEVKEEEEEMQVGGNGLSMQEEGIITTVIKEEFALDSSAGRY